MGVGKIHFISALKYIFVAFVSHLILLQTAYADWREDIGVFRIGIVVPGDIVGNVARMEPFRLAVSEALQMDVEFFPASNSLSVIDALVSERIEYAILSASGFALTSVRCECVEPLVVPRSIDSTDGYHLVAIAHAGSDVELSKLEKKNVAVLSSGSVIAESFIEYLLAKSDPAFKMDTVTYKNAGGSEKNLLAFARGDYDVLFGWSSMTGNPAAGYSRGSLRQIVEKVGMSGSQFRIIWQSEQIPHRPHVLRKKLPGEVKQALRNALVNLFDRDPVAYDSIEPEYGGGFTAARNERFRELISYLQTFNSDETEDQSSKQSGSNGDEDENASSLDQ